MDLVMVQLHHDRKILRFDQRQKLLEFPHGFGQINFDFAITLLLARLNTAVE